MGIFSSKSGEAADKPKKPAGDGRKAPETANVSTIASGMLIVGDIECAGEVRIDGSLYGNLYCKSRVVVGKKGRIEGYLDTHQATVQGDVTGEIIVRDLLTLQNSATIQGEVTTLRLKVEDGAIMTGQIKMANEAKEILQKTPTPKLDVAKKNAMIGAANAAANGEAQLAEA